jgi:hypothetical protein
MLSQWDCFLKNLGEWHGTFARFSGQGELLTEMPSVLRLEGIKENCKVKLTLTRSPQDGPETTQNYEFTEALFPEILLFETGAFCQGPPVWNREDQIFGTEFGLIADDRRLRLVQLFESSGNLQSITLIRERSPQNNLPDRPALTVDQLLGTWRGSAVTIDAQKNPPRMLDSLLNITIDPSNPHRLDQSLTFGDRTISSTAVMRGDRLFFDQGKLPIQILFLPNGVSCNCPIKLQPGIPFVLELGWLINDHLRQRLMRQYDNQGRWISATLVTEEKID